MLDVLNILNILDISCVYSDISVMFCLDSYLADRIFILSQ